MKSDKVIKCKELAEIKSHDDGRKSFQVLRVVRWNDGDPVIEKRWFLKTLDGTCVGRASGFSLTELELLIEKYDKIKALIERGDGLGQKL